MTALQALQPTFARGEISPRLFSRADIDHWKMSLAECVNWMVLKQGGLRRRPGTEWISEAKDSAKVRLIPFVFSTSQAYILELGALYMRFYANGGIVNKATATVTANTTLDRLNWTAHGLSVNDPVLVSTTGTMPAPLVAGTTYYVSVVTTNTVELSATVGGATINLTTAGTGVLTAISPVEVVTPYSAVGLWSVQYAQSADILYMADGLHRPRQLTRTGGSTFEISTYNYEDGPYLPPNITTTSMKPSGTSGSTVIRSVRAIAQGAITIDSVDGEPILVTWPGHGLAEDAPLQLITTGRLPNALSINTTYYIRSLSGSQFSLSLTPGGAKINGGSKDGNGSYFAKAMLTITNASPGVVTWYNHGLDNNDPFVFESGGTLPAAFSPGVTYYIKNKTDDTFQLSATPGGAAINTASTGSDLTGYSLTTVGVNNGDGFQATDVGRHIALQYSGKWYWAKIKGINNVSSVDVDVKGLVDNEGFPTLDFPGRLATGGWKLGAWSDLSGWPACVAFYQQRLVWARTSTQPQTVWMTKAGVLDSFATTEPFLEDDAITLTILAGQVDAIQWLAEGADLLIGTTGATRTIGPADSGKAFSATNVVQRRQSTFGSAPIQPVQVGPVAIYANSYGMALREFLFSFQQNAYVSPELTILSEHMLRSGIQQMSYAQDHDSVIWMAMGNGELVGITYERDQQIVAMTRHRIGGKADGNDDYAVVESVACIPGAERSEVWVSVRRLVNGVTRRYIERLTSPFEGMAKADAVFVDSSYTYVGAATASLSGIHWLAGETVSILADGAVENDAVVTADGVLTLASGIPATTITFGVKYLSRAKTLPIAQGSADGTGLGRRKNVSMVRTDFMETGYLEVGSPSQAKLELAAGQRSAGDAMDDSPPLVDGFKETRFDRSWKDLGQIIMQTDKPLPATVRSVTPVFEGEP